MRALKVLFENEAHLRTSWIELARHCRVSVYQAQNAHVLNFDGPTFDDALTQVEVWIVARVEGEANQHEAKQRELLERRAAVLKALNS